MNKPRIFIGNDRHGTGLKNVIVKHLIDNDYFVTDLGTDNTPENHLSEMGFDLGNHVAKSKDSLGIGICANGIGVNISANKVSGINCAVVSNLETAKIVKGHDKCNVITLGSELVNNETAIKIADAFINSSSEDTYMVK